MHDVLHAAATLTAAAAGQLLLPHVPVSTSLREPPTPALLAFVTFWALV
jgi:hypothetical protein